MLERLAFLSRIMCDYSVCGALNNNKYSEIEQVVD